VIGWKKNITCELLIVQIYSTRQIERVHPQSIYFPPRNDNRLTKALQPTPIIKARSTTTNTDNSYHEPLLPLPPPQLGPQAIMLLPTFLPLSIALWPGFSYRCRGTRRRRRCTTQLSTFSTSDKNLLPFHGHWTDSVGGWQGEGDGEKLQLLAKRVPGSN
jgi:hypothetical protein